jgi:hypothetical protein
METAALMGHVLDAEKLGILYFHGTAVPIVPVPPYYRGLPNTLRHTTFGRTPLDE